MDQLSTSKIVKVDTALGLVFGFAMICKELTEGQDGLQDHYDLQGHHIPEDVMLSAATDFMIHKRDARDMHPKDGETSGQVVFSFPLTAEIAKALDIQTKQTGLLIAMKPDAPLLAKFASGDYTGFSIGGGGTLVAVEEAA